MGFRLWGSAWRLPDFGFWCVGVWYGGSKVLGLDWRAPQQQDVGGCQNYGPCCGTLNTRCRIRKGTQKGAIILTTTHVADHVQEEGLLSKSESPQHYGQAILMLVGYTSYAPTSKSSYLMRPLEYCTLNPKT